MEKQHLLNLIHLSKVPSPQIGWVKERRELQTKPYLLLSLESNTQQKQKKDTEGTHYTELQNTVDKYGTISTRLIGGKRLLLCSERMRI